MAYPTNPIYKLVKDKISNTDICVKKQDGSLITIIPFASENSGYQEYLEWVAEGNTAEAAD